MSRYTGPEARRGSSRKAVSWVQSPPGSFLGSQPQKIRTVSRMAAVTPAIKRVDGQQVSRQAAFKVKAAAAVQKGRKNK